MSTLYKKSSLLFMLLGMSLCANAASIISPPLGTACWRMGFELSECFQPDRPFYNREEGGVILSVDTLKRAQVTANLVGSIDSSTPNGTVNFTSLIYVYGAPNSPIPFAFQGSFDVHNEILSVGKREGPNATGAQVQSAAILHFQDLSPYGAEADLTFNLGQSRPFAGSTDPSSNFVQVQGAFDIKGFSMEIDSSIAIAFWSTGYNVVNSQEKTRI